MTRNKLTLILFVLVALVQITIPIKMIIGKEEVLNEGTKLRFKVAPLDPNDPFRGKYIQLNFIDQAVTVKDGSDWYPGEDVYVLFGEDEQGYAEIRSVVKDPPESMTNYLKTTISDVYHNDSSRIYIDLPFTRFYMEESKAPKAELLYLKTLTDSTGITYALVSINKGDAVLEDVFINDSSLRELIEAAE